jgi:excisionase family DNA binding protein
MVGLWSITLLSSAIYALRQSKMSCFVGERLAGAIAGRGDTDRLSTPAHRRESGARMSTDGHNKSSSSNPRFISASDAAARLNLPTRTVQRMLKNKELPSIRFRGSRKWRIPEAALDEYIANALERAKFNDIH